MVWLISDRGGRRADLRTERFLEDELEAKKNRERWEKP